MRGQRRDDGFSLIELMVVVLIIAILLAIGIPTLLGVTQRSNDRATQQSVTNAYKVAEVIRSDGDAYTADVASWSAADASVGYTNAVGAMQPNGRVVYVALPDPTDDRIVVIGGRSTTGSCWWLRAVGGQDAPRYARNDCSGAPSAAAFGDAWE